MTPLNYFCFGLLLGIIILVSGISVFATKKEDEDTTSIYISLIFVGLSMTFMAIKQIRRALLEQIQISNTVITTNQQPPQIVCCNNSNIAQDILSDPSVVLSDTSKTNNKPNNNESVTSQDPVKI